MARARRPVPFGASTVKAAVGGPEKREGMVRIGRIVGIHGLRGALKFRLDNPASDSLARLSTITIETAADRQEYQLLAAAPAGQGMLKIELAGISDTNAAQALKGGIVVVSRASLPRTSTREFYYFQAIGCAVFLTDGTALGTIVEVFSNGANDVLVVRDGRREILVPVIEDVVKSMDLEAQKVVIEPVPGLLDD